MNTQQQVCAKEFWFWLQENQAQFDSLVETSDAFWDTALEKLKAIDEGLWFELSKPDGREREMIITAEGDEELFPLVDAMVACAPTVRGWKFIPLKPPGGFHFKTTYEGIPLDPKKMWFQPLEIKTSLRPFRIRIGVPNYKSRQKRPIENGVLVILDTALGERAVARDIECREICPLPEHPEAKGYFPLQDLPRHIERLNG